MDCKEQQLFDEKPDDESSSEDYEHITSPESEFTTTTVNVKNEEDELAKIPIMLGDICENIAKIEEIKGLTADNLKINTMFVGSSITSVCMLQTYIAEMKFKRMKKCDNKALESFALAIFYNIVDKESYLFDFIVLPSEIGSSSSLALSKITFQQSKIRREIRLIRTMLIRTDLCITFAEQHSENDIPFTVLFNNGKIDIKNEEKIEKDKKKIIEVKLDGLPAGILSYSIYNEDDANCKTSSYIVASLSNNVKTASKDVFISFYKTISKIENEKAKKLLDVLKQKKAEVSRYIQLYNATHMCLYN